MNENKKIETMENSKYIAKLIGPSLIAITLSETINAHIWATNIAPVIHLNGALLFIAGLAIVRAHNHWARDWTVAVTLTGWTVILLGLLRMFAPELVLRAVQSSKSGFVVPTMGVLVIGIYLTLKGYRREEE
jgi:hypothetical protein